MPGGSKAKWLLALLAIGAAVLMAFLPGMAVSSALARFTEASTQPAGGTPGLMWGGASALTGEATSDEVAHIYQHAQVRPEDCPGRLSPGLFGDVKWHPARTAPANLQMSATSLWVLAIVLPS